MVRADPRALTDTGPAGQGAIAAGRAIGSVSDVMFKIQQQKQRISDDTQTDRISQNMKLWAGAQEESLKTIRIETPKDQEDYLAGLTKGYDEMVTGELKGTSNGVQRSIKGVSSQMFPGIHDRARRTSSAKFIEYTATTELEMAKAEAGEGNIEAADKRVEDLRLKGIIGPKRAASEKARNAETAIKSQVAVFKQLGMEGDLSQFDEATKFINENSGILGSEETLAELRSVEMLEKFTISKSKDLNALKNLEINEDFLTSVMEKKLLPDDIQVSLLPDKANILEGDVLTKRDWMRYADDSYEPSPNTTTPAGLNGAIKTLIDLNELKLSKMQAYKELLNARYFDRSMTDEAFQLAIKRVQDPYSQQTIADIETITDENIKKISKGGFLGGLIQTDAEEERAKDVNSKLLKWIEEKIAADETPSRKEMQQRSADLRNGSVPEPVSQGPTSVKSQKDYDDLPSGSIYVDPIDGNTYRKD